MPPAQNNQKNVRFEAKNPIELYYMRRVSVRLQKRQLILSRLNEFSDWYILAQCVILSIITILIFSIQIAIIVQKTQLYYIMPGFWVGVVYVTCTISLVYMSKKFF